MSLFEFYMMMLEALAPWLLIAVGILVVVICYEIDREREYRRTHADDDDDEYWRAA